LQNTDSVNYSQTTVLNASSSRTEITFKLIIDYTTFYQAFVNKGFDPILSVAFPAPQTFGEKWILAVK